MNKLILGALLLGMAIPAMPTTNSQYEKLNKGLDRIGMVMDMKTEIEMEFFNMSLELVDLKDPKVNEIMRPHIRRITVLEQRIIDTK